MVPFPWLTMGGVSGVIEHSLSILRPLGEDRGNEHPMTNTSLRSRVVFILQLFRAECSVFPFTVLGSYVYEIAVEGDPFSLARRSWRRRNQGSSVARLRELGAGALGRRSTRTRNWVRMRN